MYVKVHMHFKGSLYSDSPSHVFLGTHTCIFNVLFLNGIKPGRVALSVGHLTGKSKVLGLIPGLATYFRFSFR